MPENLPQLQHTRQFKKLSNKLPDSIKKKLKRQLIRLAQDIHHPSLHTKKMAGRDDIWEARVDYRYRFTFQFKQKTLILRRVGSHDILKKA